MAGKERAGTGKAGGEKETGRSRTHLLRLVSPEVLQKKAGEGGEKMRLTRKDVEELAWRIRLVEGHAAKVQIIRCVWEFSPRKKRKTYLNILAKKLGMTLAELYIYAGIDIYRKFRKGIKYGQNMTWAHALESVRGKNIQDMTAAEIWEIVRSPKGKVLQEGGGKRGRGGGRADKNMVWGQIS